jgi:hypothetical protein
MIAIRIDYSPDNFAPTMELTFAFAKLYYDYLGDYYFDYGAPHYKYVTLFIKSKVMFKDPQVRSLLLEYLI